MTSILRLLPYVLNIFRVKGFFYLYGNCMERYTLRASIKILESDSITKIE